MVCYFLQAPGKVKAVVLFVHGHGAYLLHELLHIPVSAHPLTLVHCQLLSGGSLLYHAMKPPDGISTTAYARYDNGFAQFLSSSALHCHCMSCPML